MELKYGSEPGIDPATADDIARAIEAQPRDEDFWIILGDDDYMAASLEDDATFALECEVGSEYLVSSSMVDEALLRSLLLSFLDGDGQWRSMCKWDVRTPGAKARGRPWYETPRALWIPAILGPLVLTLVFTRHGEWLVVLFALAFPGLIALATVRKLGEVKRASTWTKASARIIRSGLVTVTRHDKEVQLPAVEYEFSVSLHPYRGSRISIGEIMPGTPEVSAALSRYPVGASAPVYYNPANPKESVLDRGLPEKFGMIWIFIAALAVICVGGAVWFVGPANLLRW